MENRSRYTAVSGYKDDKYLGKIKTYGIDGFDNDGNVCLHIDSVTYDSVLAEKIVSALNRNDVSLINANDVIRDMVLGAVLR